MKHFKLETGGEQDNDEDESKANDLEDEEIYKSQCQVDAMDCSQDFAKLSQDYLEIPRYYGIREFLVLTPSKGSAITDENQNKNIA